MPITTGKRSEVFQKTGGYERIIQSDCLTDRILHLIARLDMGCAFFINDFLKSFNKIGKFASYNRVGLCFQHFLIISKGFGLLALVNMQSS